MPLSRFVPLASWSRGPSTRKRDAQLINHYNYFLERNKSANPQNNRTFFHSSRIELKTRYSRRGHAAREWLKREKGRLKPDYSGKFARWHLEPDRKCLVTMQTIAFKCFTESPNWDTSATLSHLFLHVSSVRRNMPKKYPISSGEPLRWWFSVKKFRWNVLIFPLLQSSSSELS